MGLEVEEIKGVIGASEPPFRARQLYHALYRERAAGFDAITSLPAELRRRLSERCEIGLPALEAGFDSTDGTRRYLLRLADGKTVEAVWMPEPGRQTVCISTQVGCPAGCTFCMTALLGLERNLTAGEIVGQVLLVLRDRGLPRDGARVNVVMMGQGEPLLNLSNVLKATRLLTDPEGWASHLGALRSRPWASCPRSPNWGPPRCGPNWPCRSMLRPTRSAGA